MTTDLNPEERKPSWADSFRRRWHFRVEFGKKAKDGFRYLPDGSSPVATVQVHSWSEEAARRKAIYTARSLYKDNHMVLNAEAEAKGYPMA